MVVWFSICFFSCFYLFDRNKKQKNRNYMMGANSQEEDDSCWIKCSDLHIGLVFSFEMDDENMSSYKQRFRLTTFLVLWCVCVYANKRK